MNRNTLGMMIVGVLLCGAAALAQPGPGGQGFGNRGGQDPQQIQRQMQQQASDTMKQELGASDEEWAVLWPKIQKVTDAQNASGSGAASAISSLSRMFGRQMGGRAGNINAMLGIKDSEMQIRMQDLQKALDNPQSSEVMIKQLLDAARQARDRARAQLAAARKELTELLTARQEAVLFQWGILE